MKPGSKNASQVAAAGIPLSRTFMGAHRSSALEGMYAAVACNEEDVRAATREEADLDDAGQEPDLRLKRRRVRDPEVVDVEDLVAVVRLESLAQHRLPAERRQLAGDQRAGHGDHFDGQ